MICSDPVLKLPIKTRNKMKLTKENVCVFIESEAHKEEARRLLEKYGEKRCESPFLWWLKNDNENYLVIDVDDKDWCIFGDWIFEKQEDTDMLLKRENIITLTELEQILIEERK